jgi:hypothetical protein
MAQRASMVWKRLRRSLALDPGRFAGGAAPVDLLGLLAVQRERLAARRRPRQHADRLPAGDGGRGWT